LLLVKEDLLIPMNKTEKKRKMRRDFEKSRNVAKYSNKSARQSNMLSFALKKLIRTNKSNKTAEKFTNVKKNLWFYKIINKLK